MRAIFISYRREDAEGHAGRLFEDLVQRFGSASVFMDVADIEPGRDFRRVIEEQVASCGVLLAVIGKSWLDVADAQGKRRLDDPYDFVVLETASALKRDIPVIPVLVHGATMPRAEQLPDALKDLAYRNSVGLTHVRWSSDVQLLIRALLPYVDAASGDVRPVAAPVPAPAPVPAAATAPAPSPAYPPTEQRSRLPLATLGSVVAIGAVAGIGYLWSDHARKPIVAQSDFTAASQPVASVAPAPMPAPAPAPAPARTSEASGPIGDADVAKPAPAAPPPHKRPPAPAPRPIETTVATATPAPAPAPALVPAPLPPAAPPPTGAPVPDASTDAEMAIPSRADPALAIYGDRVKVSFATRTIVITPSTNYVNVTGGEIIRFVVGNKSMAWNFNGRSGSFDLARAAPALIDHKVTAYIAPNPYYPRSGG